MVENVMMGRSRTSVRHQRCRRVSNRDFAVTKDDEDEEDGAHYFDCCLLELLIVRII